MIAIFFLVSAIEAERERGRRRMSGSEKKLTNRELEILNLLATGQTLTSIAKGLHISQNTIKTHLKNLYRKLEAKDRHDAVEKSRKASLIPK